MRNNSTTIQLTDGIGRTFAFATLRPMGQVLSLGIADASAMLSTGVFMSPESARALAAALVAQADALEVATTEGVAK
jgi:hypothetical protein